MAGQRVWGAWSAVLVVVLSMAAGIPAHAQETRPRFLIESISVEGTRRESVRRIVVGQARLEPGRAYEEHELSEAVRRVKRLPFVLEARPVLRRGSAPGAYVLALQIEENARVYLAATALLTDPMARGVASGQLGLEHFIGGDGLLVGSFDGSKPFEDPAGPHAALGYTKFDAFGPATLLSLDLATVSAGERNGLRGGAGLVLPTGGDHSLQARLDVFRYGRGPLDTAATWTLAPMVNWIVDTSDDPFAPISGRRLLARAAYTRTLGLHEPQPDRPSQSLDAGGNLVVFEHLVGPLGVAPGLSASCALLGDRSCYLSGSVALRLVGATRGNRERLFAALTLTGIAEAFEPGAGTAWVGDLRIGFRSKWAVIVLGFWWSD
jgi:hypothetical protein